MGDPTNFSHERKRRSRVWLNDRETPQKERLVGLHVDPTAYQEQAKTRLRKADFTQAQVDVLAEEFGNIRSDITELKSDVSELKSGQNRLEKRFDKLDDEVGEVLNTLVRIEDHLFGRSNG